MSQNPATEDEQDPVMCEIENTRIEVKDDATMFRFEGSTFVEQQSEFIPAELLMPLDEDNSILTRAESSAHVVFKNCCELSIPEDVAVVVGDGAACCIKDEEDEQRPQELSPGAIAYIKELDDKVVVYEESPRQANQVSLGDSLFSGQTVRATRSQGRALVRFIDGCEVEVEVGHEYEIEFAEQCCLGIWFPTPYGINPAVLVPLILVPPILIDSNDDISQQ